MAVTGTGASVSGSGYTAEINSISWSGISRGSIETTHLGSTGAWKEFIAEGFTDPGELELEVNFDAGTAPPWTAASTTITVTMNADPSGTNAWSATGFMSDFELSIPTEDKQSATITFKLTGPITT